MLEKAEARERKGGGRLVMWLVNSARPMLCASQTLKAVECSSWQGHQEEAGSFWVMFLVLCFQSF